MSYVARRLTTEQVWVARLLQATCRDGRPEDGPAPLRPEGGLERSTIAPLEQVPGTPVGRSRGLERGGSSEEGRADVRGGERRARQPVGSGL
jgi:hypothetical protein